MSGKGRALIAVSIALAALSVPAPAGADVLDAYQRLAARRLTAAPLVPTAVPPSVSPIERTISNGTTRGGRGYSIRLGGSSNPRAAPRDSP